MRLVVIERNVSMKKVYFIYKRDKINAPVLYAITDKKELKNSFVEERKKSLFVVKKREISKDEFIELMKQHSSYLLGRRGFVTKPSSEYSALKKLEVVYITATQYEEMEVFTKTDSVILDLSKYTDEISACFNRKLIEALYTLKYYDVVSYCNNMLNTYNYFTEPLVNVGEDCDYRIDELGVFIYLFGYTMKGR